MERKTHYGTVTEALAKFKQQGYVHDFNLQENCIVCHGQKFGADEFEIDDIYRYEGITDPADEACVYAIHSKTGLKGVLVTGYGPTSEGMSAEILQKLQRK